TDSQKAFDPGMANTKSTNFRKLGACSPSSSSSLTSMSSRLS
ncbi:unnamed protein product, partial [Rotaria magnacalcarata]